LLSQMQWTVEAAFTPVEWSKYVKEVIHIFLAQGSLNYYCVLAHHRHLIVRSASRALKEMAKSHSIEG
jgi:hypothetical protein